MSKKRKMKEVDREEEESGPSTSAKKDKKERMSSKRKMEEVDREGLESDPRTSAKKDGRGGQRRAGSTSAEKDKRTPLQILADEASLSESSDSDFWYIVPPTPPVVAEKSQNEDEIQEATLTQAAQQEQEEPLYGSEAEDSEEEDNNDEDEFTTWKAHYAGGVASTNCEKLLVMFYEHMQNCVGRCKKERQAILQGQHIR